MDFPTYYRHHMERCELMEADEVMCDPADEADIATIPTHTIVNNIVNGLRSVGDDDGGAELARRNQLHLVPGDDWGEYGGRW